MRQSAEKIPADDSDSFPQLTIVANSHTDKKRSDDRPELLVLGWEPRQQRLASLRSSGGKS